MCHDNKHDFFQIVQMLIKTKEYISKIYSLNIKIRFIFLKQRKLAISANNSHFTSSYWVLFSQIMRDHIATFPKFKALAF